MLKIFPEWGLQQHQLWIRLGFAAVLVVFLIVAFFIKERLTDHQWLILRFFCALCAGFSGALITGEALLSLKANLGSSSKLALSGSTGMALFILIWLSFKKVRKLRDA